MEAPRPRTRRLIASARPRRPVTTAIAGVGIGIAIVGAIVVLSAGLLKRQPATLYVDNGYAVSVEFTLDGERMGDITPGGHVKLRIARAP